MAITKTKTDLYVDVAVTHVDSTVVNKVSGVVDAALGGLTVIEVKMGYTEGGIAQPTAIKMIVQGSAKTAAEDGDDSDWAIIDRFVHTILQPETEALTATEAAGVDDIAVSASTDFADGDHVFIQDAGTAADSEWVDVVELDSNSVFISPPLGKGKDSSDAFFTDAATWTGTYQGWKQYRCIVTTGGATGNNFILRGHAVVSSV